MLFSAWLSVVVASALSCVPAISFHFLPATWLRRIVRSASLRSFVDVSSRFLRSVLRANSGVTKTRSRTSSATTVTAMMTAYRSRFETTMSGLLRRRRRIGEFDRPREVVGLAAGLAQALELHVREFRVPFDLFEQVQEVLFPRGLPLNRPLAVVVQRQARDVDGIATRKRLGQFDHHVQIGGARFE